jgi:hypothetical protein
MLPEGAHDRHSVTLPAKNRYSFRSSIGISMLRRSVLIFLLAGVLFPTHLPAAFHLMSIKEVFPGTAAAPNARYVMLQMYAAGQSFVAGHPVIFYDATGAQTNMFTFTNNVAIGSDQATILIATTEAQALFGITPDLTMTAAAMIPAGGKVCFDAFDCVSWGNYSGSTSGVGNPFNPSGGLTQGEAARRRIDIAGSPTTLDLADDTNDSANDFLFAFPGPRNNLNQTTTTAPTSTTLTSSSNPSNFGDTVTFTATVTPSAAAGSVTFKDGDAVIGSVPLVSGSSQSMSMLTAGAHSITALYGGSSQHQPSLSPLLMQIVNSGTPAAPTIFSATATSTSSVALSWAASGGATMYEVHRSTSVSGMYTLSVTTGNTSAMDGLPLNANTTYLYKVRAVGSSGSSPFSTVDAATTTTFDDPAPTGVVIKATHITQARTAVSAMRVAAALAPATFTDSSLSGVVIKAEHITELRDALDAARSAIGLPPIVYVDPTITPGVTTVKAGHVLQVRSGTQ